MEEVEEDNTDSEGLESSANHDQHDGSAFVSTIGVAAAGGLAEWLCYDDYRMFAERGSEGPLFRR